MVGLITQMQRFSIHDGPGIRTTVFFKGCPLSCRWCQNPENMLIYADVLFHPGKCIGCKTCIEICPNKCFSWKGKTVFKSKNCDQCALCVSHCPVNALCMTAKKVSSDEILQTVLKDKAYYDVSGGGITLSGGEPLRQIDFCYDLLKKAKIKKLHTTLDTSGYALAEDLGKVISLVDVFLYDIKIINAQLHKKYTGVSNELILENFQRLCHAAKKIIVRIPLIPGITDLKTNLSEIDDFVKQRSPAIEIEKIPYNRLMGGKYQMLGLEKRI